MKAFENGLQSQSGLTLLLPWGGGLCAGGVSVRGDVSLQGGVSVQRGCYNVDTDARCKRALSVRLHFVSASPLTL